MATEEELEEILLAGSASAPGVAQPGGDAQAASDPMAGNVGLPASLELPPASERGPLGSLTVDPREVAPLVPRAPMLNYVRRRTFVTTGNSSTSWNIVDVGTPALLVPHRIRAGAPTALNVVYHPLDVSDPGTFGISGSFFLVGYHSQRGVCYLNHPGRWYVQIGLGLAGTIEFLEFDARDPLFVAWVLRGRDLASLVIDSTPATGVAVSVVIVTLDDILMAKTVRVRNEGANPARLRWGTVATAADTIELIAGADIIFAGGDLPVQTLNAFSTLGTTLSVNVTR